MGYKDFKHANLKIKERELYACCYHYHWNILRYTIKYDIEIQVILQMGSLHFNVYKGKFKYFDD